MPILPNVKRESLAAAAPGSLVSTAGHIFGLRAWMQEQGKEKRPVFIHLFRDSNRIRAQVVPEEQISGDTRVVNHTDSWALYVEAAAWIAGVKVNFNSACQGLLLLEEVNGGSGLGLAVGVPWIGGDCYRLRFDDWTLEGPRMIDCATTKQWNIALPHAGGGVEWPLGG